MTHGYQGGTEVSVTCEKVRKENLIPLYVAEKLPPERAEAFEKHYLECNRCFDALELTHAAAIGLVEASTAIPVTKVRRPSIVRMALASAAAVVVVALGAFYLQPTPPAGSSARPATSPVTPAKPDPALLEQLTGLQAPASPPNLVRGIESSAGARFQAGMAAYSTADYEGAVAQLSSAARLDSSHNPTTFYLGISYLMTNRFDDAIAQLSKLSAPDNPYAEDSHWYIAVAYLKKKDSSKAREELMAVLELNDVRSRDAQLLLQRLDALGF